MLGCECFFTKVDQLTGSVPLYDQASNRVTAIDMICHSSPCTYQKKRNFTKWARYSWVKTVKKKK